MTIKTKRETVSKLIDLSESWDASTEQFLNDLPTREKYEILAMAWAVRSGKDFEEMYEIATHEISAQQLTARLLNYWEDDFPSLPHHLRDAVMLGWKHFEIPSWRTRKMRNTLCRYEESLRFPLRL
jgi:hypothetical protein